VPAWLSLYGPLFEVRGVKLQAKLRGDADWTDVETAYPQAKVEAILQAMRGYGFRVTEVDAGWRVVNPRTKQVECEYRLW